MFESESTPGQLCGRKAYVNKKIPMQPSGIEPATFRLRAQCLKNRVSPRNNVRILIKSLTAIYSPLHSAWTVHSERRYRLLGPPGGNKGAGTVVSIFPLLHSLNNAPSSRQNKQKALIFATYFTVAGQALFMHSI